MCACGNRCRTPGEYRQIELESVRGRVSVSGIDPEVVEQSLGQNSPSQDVYFDLQLDHDTTYVVKIEEGVRDITGHSFPAYEFSFTTREYEPEQPPRYFVLRNPGAVSQFSDSREQVLYFEAAEISAVDFRLQRLTNIDAAILSRDWISYRARRSCPEQDPFREWTETIEEELRGAVRLYSTVLGGTKVLPKGHYCLVVLPREPVSSNRGGDQRRILVSIVDTALITKLAHDQLVVWALDYDTGKPASAIQVHTSPIPARYYDSEASLSEQVGATDSVGLAQFTVPVQRSSYESWSQPDRHLVLIDGKQRLGLTATPWQLGYLPQTLDIYPRPVAPRSLAYIFSDRPIYRPGETVSLKGIVRFDDDAILSVPSTESTFELTITDPQGSEILASETSTNELGSFSIQVALATDAPTGNYSVRLSEADGRRIGYARFRVAEYRVPEFEVNVEAVERDYVAGDDVQVEVTARFLFGQPVTGAGVEWRARSWPTFIRVEGYEDYSFEEYYYYLRYRGRWNYERGRGVAQTDAAGNVPLDISTDAATSWPTQQFSIDATVTDQNAQTLAGATTVTVHPASWYPGIKPNSYLARAGEPLRVHLVSVDYRRRVAPQRPMTVRIFEGVYPASHHFKTTPRETQLTVLNLTTGDDGETSFEFIPPKAGRYRLVAESRDDAGRVAYADSFVWVSGSDIAVWQSGDQPYFKLFGDRESYEVGDLAEVLVPAPYAGAVGLVTIARGGVLSTEVRKFETNSEVLRIPIEDRFIPNVYVSVTLYRPPTSEDQYPRINIGYLELSVSTSPRELSVSIEPDRDQAVPGDTVTYDVTVTDSHGRGVESEVSVAVFDRAVLSLVDGTDRAILESFWYERPLSVHTGTSLAVSVDRRNEQFQGSSRGDLRDDPRQRDRSDSFESDSGMAEESAGEQGPPELRPPAEQGGPSSIRSNLQSTALWRGHVRTDGNGQASIELTLPDNTTTWRAHARAVASNTRVGEGTHDLLATKQLLLRPVLPRFLRVGDTVELGVIVQNATAEARNVTLSIAAEGVTLEETTPRTALIAPGSSGIFRWSATAAKEGQATIRFDATARGIAADAVEASLPIHLDVTPESTATSGVVEDAPVVETVYIPDYALSEHGSLEVALDASLVGAMKNELAHLQPSPSQVESIVRVASRVVATIAVQRTRPEELMVAQMHQLRTDLATLTKRQRVDGSWTWCHSCTGTNMWVTGWMLFALAEAREAGHSIPQFHFDEAVSQVANFVEHNIGTVQPPDPNQHAYLLYALSKLDNRSAVDQHLAEGVQGALQTILDNNRLTLTNWGRAYLLLGLISAGADRSHDGVRALVNDLTSRAIAGGNGNHWEDQRQPGSMHNGIVRTTAIVMQALIEADPDHPLLAQTARWLVLARSADRWQSSVGRAQALSSLGSYAQLTQETSEAYGYQVLLNARVLLDGRFDGAADQTSDRATVLLDELPGGEFSRVQLQRDAAGSGRMYYGLNLRYVTHAQSVEALSRGFSVSRRYSLLSEPEREVSTVSLGDLVRVTITIVAPANRLFVSVEDLLPAGLEPIDVQLNVVSPGLKERLRNDQRQARSYSAPDYSAPWFSWYYSPWEQVDIRDDRVTLLASLLLTGVHEYVYYARASTPGDFFVAPIHAQESYVPGVFDRSDSSRFSIVSD